MQNFCVKLLFHMEYNLPFYGNTTGSMPHMSLAYSWIVRSLLNLNEPAVFKIDIFVHLCLNKTTIR